MGVMPSRKRRGKGAVNTLRVAETEPPYLTQRELQVIEWIVAGKRNDEIGKILECSPRTVQKHVQHILEKLHLETRTGVCIWWYERRLNRDTRLSPAPPRKPKRR
jgi:DNA-binding CsgD family transcriptional regulator